MDTLYPWKHFAIIIYSLWYNMPVCSSSLLIFLPVFDITLQLHKILAPAVKASTCPST